MTFKELWKRELHVAIHGQTRAFRVKKYIVLAVIFGATYASFGFKATITLLGILTIAALGMHFFFRFKTDAWTKSWGLYKKIALPSEE